MNSLHIIGNVVRDPETRTTPGGATVCSFTVAVNRRKTQNNQQPEADFFRVSAWNKLGENCSKYLAKGRKVSVVGPVSLNIYQGKDGGKTYSNLDVVATDVEFLSPRNEDQESYQRDEQTGMEVVQDDDLPF